MYQRTKRKAHRGVKPVVVKRVDWRHPTDTELLAMALLDVVESLPEAERDKLAKDGRTTIERLGLTIDGEGDDDQQAA